MMKDFTKGLLIGAFIVPTVEFYTSILDSLTTVVGNKLNKFTIDDVVYCNKRSAEIEEPSNETVAIGFQPPELNPEYETEEE